MRRTDTFVFIHPTFLAVCFSIFVCSSLRGRIEFRERCRICRYLAIDFASPVFSLDRLVLTYLTFFVGTSPRLAILAGQTTVRQSVGHSEEEEEV